MTWWLPRKTKEAAPLAEEASCAPEGGCAPSGKVITVAQRKQADRLSQTVQNLVNDLLQGIAEGEDEDYKDELPPALIPRSKIELASAKGLLAAITLVLAEGWRGNCKEELAKVSSSLKSASLQMQKLRQCLKAAADELDSAALAETNDYEKLAFGDWPKS